MEWMALANKLIRKSLIATGVSSETVVLNGTEVHFYRAKRGGSGPPLLLVHGLGSSANAFFRTLQPLAKKFSEVIAIDLPGNGFSPSPRGGPLALRNYVELLMQFRRDVIGQRVFLVGNSLGGGMALNFAFNDPDSLHALGLVSPAGAKVADERFAALLDSFRVNDAKEARVLAHKLFARPPLGILVFADELRKMVSTDTVKAIVKEVSPADMVSPADVAKLKMPVLLIWGRSEKLLPYEGLDFFRAHLPPHSEIHEVDGFGHMPQMEHPKLFVERVERFARNHKLVPH
ncbi:MAG: alpha/beta hydrolase [Myxococcaceae bacterium]